MIKECHSKEELESHIGTHKLVLVDFYADWCEPCKWLYELLEKIDSRIGDRVQMMTVDTEALVDLRSSYRIMSVPVLMLFRDGDMVWRMNGFLAEAELEKKILSFQASEI